MEEQEEIIVNIDKSVFENQEINGLAENVILEDSQDSSGSLSTDVNIGSLEFRNAEEKPKSSIVETAAQLRVIKPEGSKVTLPPHNLRDLLTDAIDKLKAFPRNNIVHRAIKTIPRGVVCPKKPHAKMDDVDSPRKPKFSGFVVGGKHIAMAMKTFPKKGIKDLATAASPSLSNVGESSSSTVSRMATSADTIMSLQSIYRSPNSKTQNWLKQNSPLVNISNSDAATSESCDLEFQSGRCARKSFQSTAPVNLELGDSKTGNGNKGKKNKKRHFKGATYHLYLSPSKKKKRPKKTGDANSKDDEMSIASTENGSWDDGSSMYSEDLNVSEKSLVDEEVHSNSSMHSPALSDVPIDSSELKTELDNRRKVIELTDDISAIAQQSSVQKESVQPEKQIPTETITHETEEPNGVFPIASPPIPSTDPNRVSFVVSCENDDSKLKTYDIRKINHASKGGTSFRYKIRPLSLEQQPEILKASTLTQQEHLSDGAGPSTITSSVKNRVRAKRRFTDDVVDTDVGLLSITQSSFTKTIKNTPPIQPVTSKWAVQIIPTATQPQDGRNPRIERILNLKQLPIEYCCCEKDGETADKCDLEYCQAIDVVDDKDFGCSNRVTTFKLHRVANRIPFHALCDMHIWRLKNHQCCPCCGRFCTQGQCWACFVEKSKHFFHAKCFQKTTDNPTCFHCQNTTGLKIVNLILTTRSPPSFHSKEALPAVGTARMVFSCKGEKPPPENENMYTIGLEKELIIPDGILTDKERKRLKLLLETFFTERHKDFEGFSIEDMYNAALTNDELLIVKMLDHGYDPNFRYPELDNSTTLHAAALNGNIVIAHLLIEAGAVTEVTNQNLSTPMMFATEKGHIDFVKYLISRKTTVEARGESGMSCLHIAAREGHLDICRSVLSSSKSQLNALDEGKWTPIVWASEHGHPDVVEFLLSMKANPNLRDNEGNTALHWAAYSGNVKISERLMDYCAIDEINNHGETPLHIAARQNNALAAEYLVTRRGNLNIRNKRFELPIDCCSDKNSATYSVLSLNMEIRKVFGKRRCRVAKLLSNDISKGRELYPIRCVNGVDNAKFSDLKFLYITENCERNVIKMDRSINSLEHCNCSENCTSSLNCNCANISFKCWYDEEGRLNSEFDTITPPMLFECNRTCACDANICRNRVVQNGMQCRLELFRTLGKGWGVRALKDIPKGTFICEYVGEVISDSEADTRAADSYLFDLDNKDGETYCLDAFLYGNISRFINHLCEPNLIPVKVFVDHQDLRFPRIAFFSLQDIKQGEELGFDYGAKFWVIKSKSFTCTCGSNNCKYRRDRIESFIASYREQLGDDSQQSD